MLNFNRHYTYFTVGTERANQGRCYPMTACKQSNGCKSFNETKSLVALKQKCFWNSNCMAVSCDVSSVDERFCHRYMLSSSCDQSTIQKRNGWTYHLMNKGKHTIIFLKKNGKSLFQVSH